MSEGGIWSRLSEKWKELSEQNECCCFQGANKQKQYVKIMDEDILSLQKTTSKYMLSSSFLPKS